MSSIDSRIVDMKFNNSQFASGVQSTIGMLGKLKANLNLDGAKKSLDGLSAAGKGFSLANIGAGVEQISAKFSALSIIGITALTNIANKAVNMGLQMAKSLTIDPIKSGFQEYEINMNSIQTILANTQRYGTKLPEVTKNLDALNTYADKTIYNFGDMTKNLGLFTNAGIKVGDATSMIKGFSNAAAASGTTAQGAAGAAYQLSQGLSAGKITLMDWKSLTNVGMGNTNMKKSLIDIGTAMGAFKGKGTDAAAAQKNFNGTLEKGWLTTDVMSTYLKFMAGDLDAAKLKTLGLSDATIKTMVAEQKTAENAATKVRTFTALIGTMRESVGSGWSESFKLIFGNFDEASTLFTSINNTFGKMIDQSSNARNKVLGHWKMLGGRDMALSGISNTFRALMGVLTAVGGAFREIFPPKTGRELTQLSMAFQMFTQKLIMGASTAENLKRTFKGVFAIFSIIAQVIKAVAGAIMGALSPLFTGLNLASGGLLAVTGSAGDWIVALDEAMKKSGWFAGTFKKVADAIKPVSEFMRAAAAKIMAFAAVLGGPARSALAGINTYLITFRGNLDTLVSGSLEQAKQKFVEISAIVSAFGAKASKAISDFGGSTTKTFSGVTTALKGFGSSAGAGASSGLQKGLVPLQTFGEKLKTLWTQVGLIFQHVGDNLRSLGSAAGGAVSAVRDGIKRILAEADPNVVMGSLNIGIFAAVVLVIKKFIGGLMQAFGGSIKESIVGTLNQLTGTLKAMQTNLKAEALLKIAAAILVLAGAVLVLSMVDPARLGPAVIAMSAMLAEMLTAMAILDKITSSKGFIKIPLLALSLLLLGGALILFAIAAIKFASMSPDDLKKGLVGLSVALAASNLARGGKMSGFALLLLALALNSIADAMEKMAKIPWDALKNGAIIMGVILVAIAAFGALPFDATRIILAAVGMLILATALTALLGVLKLLNAIPWPAFLDGLGKMALALVAIALAMQLMPVTMILSAVGLFILSGSLVTLAGAILLFAKIDWGTFGHGIAMIGAALVVLAIGLTLMAVALPGAMALSVAAFGLGLLVPVLAALGVMDWETIKQGLIAIAAVLAVLAIGGLLLIPASVGFLLFAAAMLILSVALMGLGVASVLAGVGLGAMGVGLAAIAAAGLVAIPIFLKLVQGLIDMIPMLLQKIGEGLVAFAQVIATSAPVIVSAFTAIMLALIASLAAVIPPLIALVFKMLVALVAQIVAHMPFFVQAGMNILLSFLRGIANNIGRIASTVTSIIVNFLNGLANNLPRIIQAGANLIIKLIQGLAKTIPQLVQAGARAIIDLVNGLSTAIDNNASQLGTAGGHLAVSIIKGLVSGITSGAKEAATAAWDMAKGALKAAKDAILGHSPSIAFMWLGEDADRGMVIGLNNLAGAVAESSANVGTGAIDAMRKSISGISSIVADQVDTNPTIMPVLDLSAIKKDAGLINGIFGIPSLALDTSYGNASSVAAGYSASQMEALATVTPDTSSGNTVTFKQYNTSPKALSSAEIYRQTKNQLSIAKGALTA